jgi:hypothetical protein
MDVESARQNEPCAHCTSSMQTPPSGMVPEKTARQDVGTLGRFTKSMSQSRLDSVARQDVA